MSRTTTLDRVSVATPAEARFAALRRKYGWLFWVSERCTQGSEHTHLEVTPSPI